MTDLADQGAVLLRLETIMERLETLGLVPDTTPTPSSVNPDGTPGPVASGELIESAWGNSVSNTFKKMDPAVKLGYGIVAGKSSGLTPTNGVITISFGVTFQAAPTVIVCNGNASVPCIPAVTTVNTTSATLYMFAFGTPPGPVTGSNFTVNWLASGIRVGAGAELDETDVEGEILPA